MYHFQRFSDQSCQLMVVGGDIYKRATCHHWNQKVTSTSLQVSLRKRRPWKDNLIEPNIYFKQKLLVLAHHLNMKQLHIPLSIHTYKNLRKKFLPAAGFLFRIWFYVLICFFVCFHWKKVFGWRQDCLRLFYYQLVLQTNLYLCVCVS